MLIVVYLAAFFAFAEAKIDFNRAHRLVHPNQVPVHAKDNFNVKTVKSAGYVSTYFVVDEFVGGTDCSGWPTAQFGIAFGSCFSNSDTTTAKYTLSSKLDYYVTTIYNSTDCSDAGTAYENPIGQVCVPDPDGTTYSYTVVYSSTPWKYHTTQGIVNEVYNSNCGSGTDSGDMYNWLALDLCMPSTDDNGTPNSFKVHTCYGDYFEYSVYSDTTCTALAGSGEDRVHHCVTNSDGAYEKKECTAGP